MNDISRLSQKRNAWGRPLLLLHYLIHYTQRLGPRLVLRPAPFHVRREKGSWQTCIGPVQHTVRANQMHGSSHMTARAWTESKLMTVRCYPIECYFIHVSYSRTPEIRDVIHSLATWALYTFVQTPSLHVCERGLRTRLAHNAPMVQLVLYSLHGYFEMPWNILTNAWP